MERITDRKDCCGCAACEATCNHQAIRMTEDEKGFLYPEIDVAKCVGCGLCKIVCPIVKRDKEQFVVKEQQYFACHNNDMSEWKSSSSGGIFRLLADYVIQQGGYVAGAVYDEKMVVRHYITNKKDELVKFRGSKYVQSDTRAIYKEIQEKLKTGKIVLYTGTPCQVEAVKCYLRKFYDNFLTCDIICTSVPSPRVFRDYVTFLETKYKSKIANINMKDKTKGWPSTKTRVFFESGKSIFGNIDADLWIAAWATKLFDRNSCTNCRFTNYNRPSDITIGDCWPVFHKKDSFFSPNGISQLIVNTPKGKSVLEAIKEKMTLMPITKEFAWQSKLEYPIAINPLAEEFWTDYERMTFKEVAIKYWNYNPFQYYHKKYISLIRRIPAFIKRKLINK